MISVVIPTHNRPVELIRAINSVFDQSNLPHELIVVDDASFPKISDDIFNGAPSNLTCKLISIEFSKGGNNARNIGIKLATGRYIALLDDDDVFENNKILVVSNKIKQFPEADVIYHRAKIFMVNEGYYYFTKPKSVLDNSQLFEKLLIKNIIGGTPMVIFKKDIFINSGEFDLNIPALQDYELWIRFAKNGYLFLYVDDVLTTCFYTTKNNSISKSIDSHDIAISYIEEKYNVDFKKFKIFSQNAYIEAKARVLIHKYLLNEQKYSAIKVSFIVFFQTCLLKYLTYAIAIFAGKKFIKFLKKNNF